MKKWMTLLLAMAMFVSYGNAQIKLDRDVAAKISAMKKKQGSTIKMTKADFLKKIGNYETDPEVFKYLGDKPAIVDFYATWCGPCRSISPVLEELAKEYSGKIYIYKVDTDKESELASDMGIRSLPSLLFVPMKGEPQMATGAMPKSSFKEIIEDFLLAK